MQHPYRDVLDTSVCDAALRALQCGVSESPAKPRLPSQDALAVTKRTHRRRKSQNSPNFAGARAVARSFQNTEGNTELFSFLLRRGISASPRCPGSPWDVFSSSSGSRVCFSLIQGIMLQKWGWRGAVGHGACRAGLWLPRHSTAQHQAPGWAAPGCLRWLWRAEMFSQEHAALSQEDCFANPVSLYKLASGTKPTPRSCNATFPFGTA